MKLYRVTVALVACVFIAFAAVAAPFVTRSGCIFGCGDGGSLLSRDASPENNDLDAGNRLARAQKTPDPGDDDADGAPSTATEDQVAGPDVVDTGNGSPEFVITVAPQDAVSVVTALNRAGARLLRDRNLVHLEQRLLFFSLPRSLPSADATALLAQIAPDATLDQHHIYRLAAGPRIYHTTMVGDAPGQTCRVAQPIRVGVIDGPVDANHPALKGVTVIQERFLGRGESQTSRHHGTAVAGLIAGEAEAGPLAGLAPGVSLFSAEVFGKGSKGEGARLESVATALDWLIGKDVHLINMSFAGRQNVTFGKLLRAAHEKGAVVIAAAGNDGSGDAVYPAASPDTIAVTAVDAAGRIYNQANFGEHIEFAAPGVDLYVAWDNAGTYRSGTSFATPVVTALLARQAEHEPVTLESAREVLRADVRDLGPGGRDTQFGFGLVQSGGC